ncbi:MAG: hypothetical protein KDI13_06690 [Alphaproteobacteria bacterium]|nr:hypothetical protein [Alphaproteobacteria bacterium]
MFDPGQKPREAYSAVSSRNWEADVDSVSLESCNEQEDPLGYRVVYYRRGESALMAAVRQYEVGASFLRTRLERLKQAGYDAPMTLRAIGMVEKHINGCILGVSA